jgi:hypothetical protein
MERVMTDARLRADLVEAGRTVVPSFTWSASAARHAEIYEAVRPVSVPMVMSRRARRERGHPLL